MVVVAAAIEYNFGDAFCFGSLGDYLADRLGARDASTIGCACVLFSRRRRSHSVPLLVVDHLHVDMFQTAEHSQSRPLLGSFNLEPDAAMDANANIVLRMLRHLLCSCSA